MDLGETPLSDLPITESAGRLVRKGRGRRSVFWLPLSYFGAYQTSIARKTPARLSDSQ
jgi:hypothetical protein